MFMNFYMAYLCAEESVLENGEKFFGALNWILAGERRRRRWRQLGSSGCGGATDAAGEEPVGVFGDERPRRRLAKEAQLLVGVGLGVGVGEAGARRRRRGTGSGGGGGGGGGGASVALGGVAGDQRTAQALRQQQVQRHRPLLQVRHLRAQTSALALQILS